jgi:hypothetical protein
MLSFLLNYIQQGLLIFGIAGRSIYQKKFSPVKIYFQDDSNFMVTFLGRIFTIIHQIVPVAFLHMKSLFLLLLFVASGCNSAGDNKINADSLSTKKESLDNGKDTANKGISAERSLENTMTNDSTMLISFPKDSTWVTVNGKMKGINSPVTVYIPVKQGKRLSVTILPEDSVANIRINQIFTPDGKADGPFGRELKRALHQQGTYKLIIAENMMQGDEWKGNFKLTVRVE